MKYLSFLIAFVASAGFAEPLPHADVFILGEVHDNPAHHQIQADLVSDLAPKALVFEMLSAEEAANIAPAAREDSAALEALAWWGRSSKDSAAEFYVPILLAASEAKIYGAHVNRATTRAAMEAGVAAHFGTEAAKYGLSSPLSQAEQSEREAFQLAAHCDALPAEMLPVMVELQRLRDAELARATAQALAETGGPVVVITGNGHARKDWGMPVYLSKAAPDVQILSIGQGEDEIAPEGQFDRIKYSPAAKRDDPCAAFTKD